MSTNDKLIHAFDAIVHETYKPDEPGAAVIVVKDGAVIYRKGIGMANLELGVPIEPDMVFRLGSITKQFTATAILMLMQQGKLALDEPIRAFFPDYPTHGENITVRHLLTHTSGIRSYTDMLEWRSLLRKDLTLQELIDFFKDQPMQFTPGQRWSYNNSGYVLLGAIIENVSGQSYERFLQSHIFDPLGMKQICYDRPERIIRRRASGYDKVESGYINAPYLSMTHPHAAGALAASVDDLAKWDAGLDSEQLLEQSILRQAFVSHRLLDGTDTGYGFGWVIGAYEGRRICEHGGGINGFRCHAIRMPDDHVFVAVLTNQGSKDPEAPAFKLAAAMVGKPYVEPARINLDGEALARLAGVYQYDASANVIITCEGQRLFAQFNQDPRFELIPIASNRFMLEPQRLAQVIFVDNPSGEAGAFEIKGRTGMAHTCKRVDVQAGGGD